MMRVVLLVGLLVLPGVVALTEDFEDDTVGMDPSQSWYTYSEAAACFSAGPTYPVMQVVGELGPDGSAQTFEVSSVGGVGQEYGGACLTVNDPLEFDYFGVSFKLSHCGLLGNPTFGVSVNVLDENVLVGRVYVSFDDCTAAIFTDDDTVDGPVLTTGWHRLEYRFDYDADTYTVEFDGDGELGPFEMEDDALPGNDVVDLDEIQLRLLVSAGVATENLFDNVVLGAEPEVVVGVPAEFDSGLVGFAASMGFVSRESQLLFTLILVGFATVGVGAGTKLLASSRWKNYGILGVGALVGVFGVLIGFLEVWEWLVCFMLGVFAVRGGSEARNTFLELRGKLGELVSGADPDNAMGGAEMGIVAAPDDFVVNDAAGEESGPEAAAEPDGDAVEDEEVDS